MAERNKIIPTSFQMFGSDYLVEFSDTIRYEKGCIGEMDYFKNKITIQSHSDACPISVDEINQTYLHEVMHLVLKGAEEDGIEPPLHTREVFVDRMASLLYQVLKTSKYGED